MITRTISYQKLKSIENFIINPYEFYYPRCFVFISAWSLQNNLYENKKVVYWAKQENVLARLGRHSEALEKNRSDCLEMQKEYNLYGKKAFSI